MKRIFDSTASVIGLIVLSPILAMAAILIKLADRGPVLFRQERIGRNFRPFTIYKLRSMRVGIEANDPCGSAANDCRITPIGRILRKSKIDEIPQLYNVILGDMSLVGPRPMIPEYVNRFREEYAELLILRPGITDPASIAYRDEGRLLSKALNPEHQYLNVILPDKLRLAKEYVHKRSFIYDLQLIITTVVLVVYPSKLIERLINSVTSRPHRRHESPPLQTETDPRGRRFGRPEKLSPGGFVSTFRPRPSRIARGHAVRDRQGAPEPSSGSPGRVNHQ